MPNLRDIRKRIRSVKNTQKITRAMKMVAAAKLRRAQERTLNARPYADSMLGVVRHIVGRSEPERHRLLQAPSAGYELVVVIASDRGLCGGFNANVNKRAMGLMKEAEAAQQEAKLYVVGRKAREFFRNRPYEIVKHKLNIFQKLEFGHGKIIGDELMELYLTSGASRVVLVYNRFKSLVSQELVATKLLPFEPADASSRPGELDYVYEPDADGILARLLPLAVHIQVFHALLESAAAEQAARQLAMDNATKNAEEMIDQLTLNMNKVRQASITRELIEVVSGAQSLTE